MMRGRKNQMHGAPSGTGGGGSRPCATCRNDERHRIGFCACIYSCAQVQSLHCFVACGPGPVQC